MIAYGESDVTLMDPNFYIPFAARSNISDLTSTTRFRGLIKFDRPGVGVNRFRHTVL